MVLSAHQPCGCGAIVTRPRCGLRPKSPQQADGIRIEPPPSPPSPNATSPAATAAAVPPLEPPGDLRVSHGLRVMPCATDSVNGHCPNSGMFVLPTTTAPAARSRRTTSASAAAGVVLPRPPNVVTRPATSSSSLIATGTPCNGPRSPACVSRAAASASDSSARTVVKALSCPSYRWMRSRTPVTSSTDDTCPEATAAAWPVTPANQRSSSLTRRSRTCGARAPSARG